MKNRTKIDKVIIVGAGPVGIAAAAHLKDRGLNATILEKGASAGHSIKEWGHVRVFTPWQYVTDKAVLKLLEKSGWTHPDKDHLPTGHEIVDEYLVPAAATVELKNNIIYNANVLAVSKRDLSKSSSLDRDTAPFTVHYLTTDGVHHVSEADVVIDASGTWYNPNPIGTDGLPIAGEIANSDLISYGIPEVFGNDQTHYEGKKTLVLGGGHSAINAVLNILQLKDENPSTKLIWGLRSNKLERLLGGGINDELPARGALGIAAKKAIEEGTMELMAPMSVRKISRIDDSLSIGIIVDGENETIEVDRIIVAAGFRPDIDMLREIRLNLDDVVEAPTKLAPMIDPNLHSCGTVRPHGVVELTHPDKNFFIVGMKAYGRAPTFLVLTGYEQVRSIADDIIGNYDAARKIELELPETGVCSSDLGENSDAGGICCAPEPNNYLINQPKETIIMTDQVEEKEQADGCCGGPAPTGVDACCVKDADAKANGEEGCGCNSEPAELMQEQPSEPCCG